MVCYVSKWGRVFILVLCLVLNVVMLVSGVRVVYLPFCVLSSMVCYVSKWVRVVYLPSVSCPQWCVMLVSGSVLFIFVLCPVLNGVLC